MRFTTTGKSHTQQATSVTTTGVAFDLATLTPQPSSLASSTGRRLSRGYIYMRSLGQCGHSSGVTKIAPLADLIGVGNDVQTDIPRLHPSRIMNQGLSVLAQRRSNPIAVTPVVDGAAGDPWQNGVVLRYASGSRDLLLMSTGRGTAIDLEVLAPCLLSGNSRAIVPTEHDPGPGHDGRRRGPAHLHLRRGPDCESRRTTLPFATKRYVTMSEFQQKISGGAAHGPEPTLSLKSGPNSPPPARTRNALQTSPATCSCSTLDNAPDVSR